MFEVSGVLHEMLLLMDGTLSPEEIATRVSERLSIQFYPSQVNYALEKYFYPNGLVLGAADGNTCLQNLQEKVSPTEGVLLCPARRLFPITRWLRLLFHGPIMRCLLILVALCQMFVFNPSLLSGDNSPLAPLSSEDYMIAYLLLLLSVLFHELGHLSACSYYGCEHGELRVGLYLVFPVFYSNVTKAWVLPRKSRVMVDLGGIYFQMLLCVPAMIIYWITGKSLCIYFCMGLISMSLFAFNPFLRFDGYWICSDLLGVPNLRTRSRIYLKQVLSSWLRKRKVRLPILEIRKAEKIGLINYAILSHLFLVVFLGLLFWLLPKRFAYLSSSFPTVQEKVLLAFHNGDVPGMVGALFPLLFPCILFLAMARMLWRSIRGFTGMLFRRINKQH